MDITEPGDLPPGLGPLLREETIVNAVTERLRSLILQGRFLPGARLRQVDVAEELGVSTTPVREALRALTADGLLDSTPHRGVSVHNRTREELLDLFEMRLALEPIAMRTVVECITSDELAAALALANAMEYETRLPSRNELNTRFHHLIDKACRRPLLIETITKLRHVSAIYVAQPIHDAPHRMQIANRQHRQLLSAVEQRDLEAAQEAVRSHLAYTLDLGLLALQGAAAGPGG